MKMINNNNWRLLFTPDVDPYMNMAIDEALARRCRDTGDGQAAVRFYTWKEASCSIGYFQKIENVLKTLKDKSVPIVRRPTGGGIVFHGNDITFSIIRRMQYNKEFENITSIYKIIGNSIITGLKKLDLACYFFIPVNTTTISESGQRQRNYHSAQQSFCSARPVQYDILINGEKVAGYAARRSQGSVLCQGYLDLYERWKEKSNSTRAGTINLLFDSLTDGFEKALGITLVPTQLTEEEERLAYKIRNSKYACKKWNYRR